MQSVSASGCTQAIELLSGCTFCEATSLTAAASFCRGRFPQEGEQVTLDDDLILYLIKQRQRAHAA
jgi:hypothetical protein